MSKNKQSSVEILEDFLLQHCNPTICNIEWSDFKLAIEQAKAMHKEEVRNSYISGYLDNGYYEGAEEDASKLWDDTYGFAHNETFGQ